MLARALILVLLLACTHACAQPRYGLSDEAYAVFAQWMATSCVGDEAQAWRERLLRQRASLLPAFRRALADGPPEEMIAPIRKAADVRYRALAAFAPAEYRIVGLPPQDVARVARVPRQSFVDDQVARFATGYKSNAIAALAIIGDAPTRTTLARLAARRDDPLAIAAAEAVRGLDRR
jgi:hypothetical protein